MRPLPPAPVFTVEDALAAGWTASALKNAVRRGRVTRLRRGVYTSAPEVDAALQATGAALRHPASVISHRSAALVHGLPLLGPRPPQPELTVRPRGNIDIPAAHVYRATLRRCDTVLVEGAAVTSVARTLVDLARHAPLGTAVAAMDSALNRGLTTVAAIDDVALFCWNWPGIGRARRAMRLIDPLAESPLESISRLTLRRLQVPTPASQVSVLDREHRFVGRGDFYWDEFGVVGEADGRGKYDDRDVLTAEKARQERLEDLGLVVVRWGWSQVTRSPQTLRLRLENGFERGRRRDGSGFPRLWTSVAPPERPQDRRR